MSWNHRRSGRVWLLFVAVAFSPFEAKAQGDALDGRLGAYESEDASADDELGESESENASADDGLGESG